MNIITNKGRKSILFNKSLDWYIVDFADGDAALIHFEHLRAVFAGESEKENCGILKIERCKNKGVG